MERFDDRKILVTGAGSGIGQATVRRLLNEGGTVVAADVSDKGLAATAEQAGRDGTAERLSTLEMDVSGEGSVRAGVAEAVARLGGLDVAVNAAGILRSEHTEAMSLDMWNTVIGVNLTGTFLVTREALPALLGSGHGVVVNFSSTSAAFAHPYMAAYAASKGGIQAFTHAIALEYAKRGLRAVCVAPGSITSGMTDASGSSNINAGPGFPEDADLRLVSKLLAPLRGNGHGFAGPDAVAGVVAMLASDDGAWVTGTELRIDGGTHM